jgi:uncharacterized protein
MDRRVYRARINTASLSVFTIQVEQTDLLIRAEKDLAGLAYDLVRQGRERIEAWGRENSDFLTSFKPLPLVVVAPSPVREMMAAGAAAGVGPMAAVAGALAQFVGQGLLNHSPNSLIIENGGDVFLAGKEDLVVALFAGKSTFSLRLGLKISHDRLPLGIGTSSGTVGHSMSYGRADAATVIAESAALADAAATALGNRIVKKRDIEPALEWVNSLEGVRGAVVILGEYIGFLGEVELVGL